MDPGLGRRANPTPVLDAETLMCPHESLVLQLIEETADVNTRDDRGNTPLHHAMRRGTTAAALALIEKGADINARGEIGQTPLHVAVSAENLEMVCLLLYHNVDVTVTCDLNNVAFMEARGKFREAISYALLKYHDEFPVSYEYDHTALLIFARGTMPIVFELVEMGVDINAVDTSGTSAITCSIAYPTADFFKLLWPRINYDILFCTRKPFLLLYLEFCAFHEPEWLECLYMLLDSPVALELVENAINFYETFNVNTALRDFLYALPRHIAEENTMEVLYTLLTLGFEVRVTDVDFAIHQNTPGQAHELAYFLTNYKNVNLCGTMLIEFLALTRTPNCYTMEHTYALYKAHFSVVTRYNRLIPLGYFSLSTDGRNQILEILETREEMLHDLVKAKLEVVPTFPTLLELARNIIRTAIQYLSTPGKPYQFYDAIQRLPLPTSMKDIISFKKPLFS